MTRFMESLEGSDFEKPGTALPPRTITAEAIRGATGEHPHDAVLQPATVVAHYSYGGAVGSVFPLVNKIGTESQLVNGALYGLGVWGASYLGLLPALGSSARATNRSLRTNAIMIAAHVVWGMSLAVLMQGQKRLLNSPAAREQH